ncbi:MAG: T9SS type A sorting domain-containing protein, partial [Bacteroidota bacterium]|nr:T9SS type A sorting domain-containing protein [Bacteroidota bacterium]
CGVYTIVKLGYLGSGYCGGYYAMSLSPNPSSGETTLTIEPTSEDVIFDENTEWEVEIFDQRQMLKEKRLKLKGRDQRIQTSGWKSGIYIVRVKYKDENLQAKLVVK